MIEEDIRTALASLFSNRVHPLRRPQREKRRVTDDLPELVYTIISQQHERTLCGIAALRNVTVQMDIYASHYREARELAAQVIDALVDLADVTNEVPLSDDEEKIHRRLLEFSWWRDDWATPL